jgi:hypothetical protein
MGEPSTFDREATSRLLSRLDYENTLLVQRTTWIVASQAFLISAYVGCLIGTGSEQSNPHKATLELLVMLLPWTGVLSLLAFGVSIGGGLVAIVHLKQAVRERQGGAWDRLMVEARALPQLAGLFAPVVVPGVFLLTWAAVLVLR